MSDPQPSPTPHDLSDTMPESGAQFPNGLAFDAPHLPEYELLEELGRGGMGIVYKARHRRLDRLVALKLLRTDGDAEHRERFRREAEAAAQLSHANVVSIYEIGEHEGRAYLALEYVQGGSLADHLRVTPLESHAAAHLLEVLARAMHTAHLQGVVHRDLKPANILLCRGTADHPGPSSAVSPSVPAIPKISDFGLAKRIETRSGLTQTGAIIGTPSYMAPEQALGRGAAAGPPVDIYGLGAILYECLTCQPPFRGVTVIDTLEQVCAAEPRPLRQLNARVPRDLETICLKCLTKEPRKRYASALALADDLRRFLDGHPIVARRAGRLEIAAKWSRRNPGWAAAVLAVAVGFLAACLLSVFLYRSRDRLADSLQREQGERERAERAERTTREKAHAEIVTAARVAVDRGLWDRALTLFDQAIAEDFDDAADLQVERLRCLLPSRDRQRLRDALDRLPADERDPHRAELQLYRATLLLTEQDNYEKGLALLRQALTQPDRLRPADRYYARGLLADTSDEAEDYLRRAVRSEPFHHPARSALLTELLVTGRFDDAHRQADLMRDFYPNDPLPDYVLALAAVLQNRPEERDRHLEALGKILPPAEHRVARQYLVDLAAVLRIVEAINRGEKVWMNVGRLASRMPALQVQWMSASNPIALPAPPVARLFRVFEDTLTAYRLSLFDREAALRRLREAARRHPEAVFLYLIASYEFLDAAQAQFASKDRARLRSILLRARDRAAQAVEAPTLLPSAPFRFEARLLAVLAELLLRILDREERLASTATSTLLAPCGGNPISMAVAAAVCSASDPPSARQPWLEEQLHHLANEGRRFPELRAEKFPLLIQTLDAETALSLLRRWQDDEPTSPQLLCLRAETELRAGHLSAALAWSDRAFSHPRASARERAAMRSLQARTRARQGATESGKLK